MQNNPIYQKRFRRDVRSCETRGYDISLLRNIMKKLVAGEPLDPILNRPHLLTGTNPQIIECHIKGDWLLEYRYHEGNLIFIRTGTHADLLE